MILWSRPGRRKWWLAHRWRRFTGRSLPGRTLAEGEREGAEIGVKRGKDLSQRSQRTLRRKERETPESREMRLSGALPQGGGLNRGSRRF